MNFFTRPAVRRAGLFLCCVAVAMTGQALAQDTDDDAIEEVVVKGYRSSLARAIDIKHDSVNVRDSTVTDKIGIGGC